MIPQLAHLATDPARPRVTYYNDATSERIELSGSTLLRWVNKASNWLQDEMDAGPGTGVQLDLPADHWRSVAWILAVWAVGATLVTQDGDVRVAMDDPSADLSEPEASLAPSDLTGQPDAFAPYAEPAPDDEAVAGGSTYADLSRPRPADAPRLVASGDLVADVADVFGRDGSLLLLRHEDAGKRADRLREEAAD